MFENVKTEVTIRKEKCQSSNHEQNFFQLKDCFLAILPIEM